VVPHQLLNLPVAVLLLDDPEKQVLLDKMEPLDNQVLLDDPEKQVLLDKMEPLDNQVLLAKMELLVPLVLQVLLDKMEPLAKMELLVPLVPLENLQQANQERPLPMTLNMPKCRKP
jgi:hypothetical protein